MKKRFNQKHEDDTTPSREVVAHYRAVIEDEEAEENIGLAMYRGGVEELEIGREYCKSDDPLDRQTGAHLLGQLGWSDSTFLDETIEILIPMLQDHNVEVIIATCFAIGHRTDPRPIPNVVPLASHPSAEVRYAVTSALLGHENFDAVRTMISLTRDEDADVRNWALFGIGTQIDTDTPDIRHALILGLQEECHEARGEALVGLAKRGDHRVVTALLKEWEKDMISLLSLEAAEFIAAPELTSPLLEFKDSMELDDDPFYLSQLEDAINACMTNA